MTPLAGLFRDPHNGTTAGRGPRSATRLRWVQQGNDTLRRTRFHSYPLGVNGGGLPSSVKGPLATAERMAYDALDNLQESSTVDRGTTLRTQHQRDAIGRDTLVTSPAGARSILRYDAAGRVVETLSIGPATEYTNRLTSDNVVIPEQKLWVHTYTDAEGQPDSVARWQSPDSTAIGRIVTRWRRDALGRQVQEIAPDATPANLADNPRDSTVFDAAGNAVAVRSRRGLWTRMEYDALNRVTARRGDAAAYGAHALNFPTSKPRLLAFPLFGQDAEGNFTGAAFTGAAGVTIRGDTSTFEYDVAGNMTGAINRDAVVRREYNVNGTMRSETQRIRTYAGLDTTAHAYRLEYTYDLNGRRTSLKHPQIFDLGGARQTGYAYDTIAGALAFVSDPNGGGYSYRYDVAGRLDRRTRGSVVEAFSYDSLGRLEHRVETSGGNAVPRRPARLQGQHGQAHRGHELGDREERVRQPRLHRHGGAGLQRRDRPLRARHPQGGAVQARSSGQPAPVGVLERHAREPLRTHARGVAPPL